MLGLFLGLGGDVINTKVPQMLRLGSLLAYRREGWESLIKTQSAARAVTIQPSATQTGAAAHRATGKAPSFFIVFIHSMAAH